MDVTCAEVLRLRRLLDASLILCHPTYRHLSDNIVSLNVSPSTPYTHPQPGCPLLRLHSLHNVALFLFVVCCTLRTLLLHPLTTSHLPSNFFSFTESISRRVAVRAGGFHGVDAGLLVGLAGLLPCFGAGDGSYRRLSTSLVHVERLCRI